MAAAAAGYSVPVVPGVHSVASVQQAVPSDSWLRNGLAFNSAIVGTVEPSLDDRSAAVGRNDSLSSSFGRSSRPFSQDRLVEDPSRLSWQTGVVDGNTVAESDFGLQQYSLRAAVGNSSSSAAGKSSSSEGNETSMLMDVPGYVSAAERRRLLSSDLLVKSQCRLSSDSQGPSRPVHKHSFVVASSTPSPATNSQIAQVPASSAPNEPSTSSIWTDMSHHYGRSNDSFLYEPTAADSSGEAMRMGLDRMAIYECGGVEDGRSCDSRSSLHSTETEYQMLPAATSPPGHRTAQQHSTREVQIAAVPSAQSSMQDVPAYATPPLRGASGRERSQPASAHSSPPFTAVTMSASPGSTCAARTRDWGSVGGDITAASATRRRSIKSDCSSIGSGLGECRLAVGRLAEREDDHYVPVDPFSDTSCLSAATGDCSETGRLETGYCRTSSALHSDCRPCERWQSRQRSLDCKSRSSDGMCSGTLSLTSSPPSVSTSGTSHTADVEREASELDYIAVLPGASAVRRGLAGAVVTAGVPAGGTSRTSGVTAVVSAAPSAVPSRLASPSKKTTLVTSAQLPVVACRPLPGAAFGTVTPIAVTTSAASAVRAVNGAVSMTPKVPSLSTSEVVSSRLDHIEAMVMKALERQQLDGPSGELERSISETIRRLRPDLSATKTDGVKATTGFAVAPAATSALDSSIDQTKFSSATVSAAASATTTVTAALALTAASRTLSKTPTSDCRRPSASLPTSKAGGEQSDVTNGSLQKSCVQPLKDLSLNLSLLPDRTQPTFSAFSSAKNFLSEQLKCRAGERTPGRSHLSRPADEELAFSSLSDQENLPASDQDTHASDISGSAAAGSLLHLQPHRSSGKKAFTYVLPSHTATTDDALSMATTVESTHPDSDDTRPPHLPAEVLGSRTDPAHRAPGIYGTRRPRVVADEPMHAKLLSTEDRLAQQKDTPQPPNRRQMRTVRNSSTDGNVVTGRSQAWTTNEAMPINEALVPTATPAPATVAPSVTSGCTATSCSTATSAYTTGPSSTSQHQVPAAHLGSVDYAQQLRERANSLLRLTEQLGNGSDDRGDSVRAARDASSRTENQPSSDVSPRPDATARRFLACNLQPGHYERFEQTSIACSRRSDEEAHASHQPPPRGGSGRVALHQDKVADRLDAAGNQARQQVLSNAAKVSTLHNTNTAHSERAVSAIPNYSHRDSVAISRVAQAGTLLAGEQRSRCANAERLRAHRPPLADDRRLTSVSCSPPPSGAAAATGRRALERSSDRRTSPSSQRQAASASGANKPGFCAAGMWRTPSLSSSPSARRLSGGRGRNSRAGDRRSSSTSPSPSSRALQQLPLVRSPDVGRRPSPHARSINRQADLAIGSSSGGLPGDKAQQPSSTTASTLRSKLTDVIKDRQLTYRVLIEELTNAEDIRKRTMLNQAWSEANQKRNDESSLSDEKLQRLCDLLRNPLRHLITKSKGNDARPSRSPDRERRQDRHLEAVRSTVLQQKTAAQPTSSVTDRFINPGHERKVILRDSSTSPTREGNLKSRGSNDYEKDRDFEHACTDGHGRSSGAAAVTVNSAVVTYGAGTNLVAERICKSPTHGKKDKRPNPASEPLLSAKSASVDVGQPEEILRLGVEAENLLSHRRATSSPTDSVAAHRAVSLGDGDARQARDSVMWYQPFSQKEAEASTFENARQHFSEHRGCSWFVALGEPKPWKRLPIERHANRVGQEPWFPVATKVNSDTGGALAHRRRGNTELNPLVSAAERRVLRELDFARHDLDSRSDRANVAGGAAESRRRILTDEPMAKGTLQEAFERRKQEFISRSRERLRRVALRSEERAINCLHDAERERLFGLRAPLTAAPGEKLPGRYGSAATAAAGAGVARTSSARHLKQRDFVCFTGGRFEHSGRHRAPPKRMAPISKHEMYERTRRMCTELPEKQYRDMAVRRRQECTVHRSRARIFNKKVLHSVLRKAHILKKTRR